MNTNKIAIVTAPFYQHIIDGLYWGAEEYLGIKGFEIERFNVPGALEIPLLAQFLAKSEKFDAIVAIGAVIRGETAHFDHVCQQSARGLMDVSLNFQIPIGNGIITVENEAQALARSANNQSNKGREAAVAAYELLVHKRELQK